MRDFEASVARIFSGEIVRGAGFLVSDKHLITCAHVISAALNIPQNISKIPTDVVEFDLPLIAPNQRVKARVVFWQPVKPGSIGEDIAVLEVLSSETLPVGVKVVQLIISEEVWGHTFRVYGFPHGNDDGVWAEGVIREKQASQWIQIEGIKAQGYAIESGFSGAPIWDDNLKGVIGMTVAAERDREEARVAYLIPSTVLKQAWSTLVIKPSNKTLRVKNRKKIAVGFASTALLLLVVFHFIPPVGDTQRYIIIALISFLLVTASLVFVNTLEKREDVGIVEIRVAASILSFIVAVISSHLFIDASFEGDGYTHSGKISFQYYTASEPFSVLSFAKSKFSDEFRNGILKSSITPLIYQKSPAFLALEKFIAETGNNDFIRNTADAYVSYSINLNGQTKQAYSNNGIYKNNRIFGGEQRQPQTREEFDKSGITSAEDSTVGFSYATLLSPFQEKIDNAAWTSFIDSSSDINKGVGAIIQYPKLSTLLEYNIKEENVASWKKSLVHDTWIKKIVENNPDNRGFLGYIYRYFNDLSSQNTIGGCGDWTGYLGKAASTPYIRFADVVNSSRSDIRISSISYRMIGQIEKLYSLNNTDDRIGLFENGHIERDNLEPSGFSLRPDQHLLIPIEFGFDTRSHNAAFLTTPPTGRDRVINLARKKIYITEPNSTLKNYQKYGIPGITKSVQLSSEFVGKSKSKDDLFNSIPKRFSVGPVINIESISIDKTSAILPPPMQDTSSIRLFEGYQSGSCPYVSIQRKNSNSWQDLGTVLYGRYKNTLQDTEIRYFGDNVSSIQIEEREKEITYIDYLSVLYFDPISQQDREIFPKISSSIETIDSKYHTLKQGEKININIHQLLPSNAQRIRIKINGYYLPFVGKDFRFPVAKQNTTNATKQ